MASHIIFKSSPQLPKALLYHVQRRHMPVNVPPTATGKRRFRLAVETDPHILVNYCCGVNYHIDEPLVPLKPDNEYPDWLWELRLHPKPKSWEMEKGTKEYYKTLAEEGRQRNILIKLRAGKTKKIVDKVILSKMEYIHHKRFAALAYLEDDAGLDMEALEDEFDNPQALRKSDYYLPMHKDRVLYMDKIPGNIAIKNWQDDSQNSWKVGYKPMKRPPAIDQPKKLDNRQRHRYSIF